MPSYIIVGASRGMGLEFVRQLATRETANVFAIVRNTNNSQLQSLSEGHPNVHVVQGDIVDHRSLQNAADRISQLSGGAVDVLINNPAVMDPASVFQDFKDYTDLDELDADFTNSFQVNTLGAIHSTAVFLPLLRRGAQKKVIFISSGMADPAMAAKGGISGTVAYSTTKAATVMVAAKYAAALKDEGFTVISLLPGVVATTATAADPDAASAVFRRVVDMHLSRGHKLDVLTPAQSVEAQLRVIDAVGPEQNGAFLSYDSDLTK